MWFTETPWPPIMVLGLLAVVLLIVFQSKQQVRYLVGVAFIVLGGVGIYFVEQQIITESERVEAGVFGVTTAFREKDLAATLEFFSPENKKDRSAVESAIVWVKVEDKIRITDLYVNMSNDDTRAVSHFRANVTGETREHGRVSKYPSRWEFTWQLEDGEWRITKIQRLHVMSGDHIPLRSVQ